MRGKITADGNSARDAMARIRKASQTFAMLKSIWKSKQLRLKTKLRPYKSNILRVLLYVSKFWKLTAKLAHKLENFQNRCLQKILGVFLPNTITNEELLHKTDATSLSTQIKRRRWRWLGNMCRMSPDALPNTAEQQTLDGRRRPGHPKKKMDTKSGKGDERMRPDIGQYRLEALCVSPGMKRIE